MFSYGFIYICRIYGPNSEIEWNKESRRGFLIINRKPSQSALSSVADNASNSGYELNKMLPNPSNTKRDRTLIITNNDKDSNHVSSNVVIADEVSECSIAQIFFQSFEEKQYNEFIFDISFYLN